MGKPKNMRGMAKPAAAWLIVAAWAAFIFFMSAHTGSDLAQGEGMVAAVRRWLDGVQEAAFGPGVDVVSPAAHFLEYAVLGMLCFVALRTSGVGRCAALAAVGICALYAVTDEFHQMFVPGRACDPADWAVDVAGSSAGAIAATFALRLKARLRYRCSRYCR